MGKIYTLTIPTWIDGINTTIEVGTGSIQHVVFDGGMEREKFYNVLLNGDFKGSVVNLITDDIDEFVMSVKSGLGTTVIPYEATTAERVTEILKDMKSRMEHRYNTLSNNNKKNIDCYNNWAGKHNQMKPVVICCVGADKMLRQLSREDAYNLIVDFLKVGRVTGVVLLLHSDEFYGLQESMERDMYEQFAQVHISMATEHTKDVTVLMGGEAYHASVGPRDRL